MRYRGRAVLGLWFALGLIGGCSVSRPPRVSIDPTYSFVRSHPVLPASTVSLAVNTIQQVPGPTGIPHLALR